LGEKLSRNTWKLVGRLEHLAQALGGPDVGSPKESG
jgi:hypothetical protein